MHAYFSRRSVDGAGLSHTGFTDGRRNSLHGSQYILQQRGQVARGAGHFPLLGQNESGQRQAVGLNSSFKPGIIVANVYCPAFWNTEIRKFFGAMRRNKTANALSANAFASKAEKYSDSDSVS
uniref:Uncharacterized protein n=1 Tax=Romanomermis culicivorax TaxID=13658 RepID=A0A915HVH9_ROMCU